MEFKLFYTNCVEFRISDKFWKDVLSANTLIKIKSFLYQEFILNELEYLM